MFVKDRMTYNPISVGPQTNLQDAERILSEQGIRHLPVVQPDDHLLGLVTRQRLHIPPEQLGTLSLWEITRYFSNLTVEQVMVKAPELLTIGPEASLQQAVQTMIADRIGSLPVVEDGRLVGILTETDLLFELQAWLETDIQDIADLA